MSRRLGQRFDSLAAIREALFQEKRAHLHAVWVRELSEFQAEADGVRAEPAGRTEKD